MRDLATQRPFIVFLPAKPGPDFYNDLAGFAPVGYACHLLDKQNVPYKQVTMIFEGTQDPVPALLVDSSVKSLVWDLIREDGHPVIFLFDAYRVCTAESEDGATNVVIGALARKHNTAAASVASTLRLVDGTTVYTVG